MPVRSASRCRPGSPSSAGQDRAEQPVQARERRMPLGFTADRPQYPATPPAHVRGRETEQRALADTGVTSEEQHLAPGPADGETPHDLPVSAAPAGWQSGPSRGSTNSKRLRIRYERRADLHQGLLALACSIICLRRLRRSF